MGTKSKLTVDVIVSLFAVVFIKLGFFGVDLVNEEFELDPWGFSLVRVTGTIHFDSVALGIVGIVCGVFVTRKLWKKPGKKLWRKATRQG